MRSLLGERFRHELPAHVEKAFDTCGKVIVGTAGLHGEGFGSVELRRWATEIYRGLIRCHEDSDAVVGGCVSAIDLDRAFEQYRLKMVELRVPELGTKTFALGCGEQRELLCQVRDAITRGCSVAFKLKHDQPLKVTRREFREPAVTVSISPHHQLKREPDSQWTVWAVEYWYDDEGRRAAIDPLVGSFSGQAVYCHTHEGMGDPVKEVGVGATVDGVEAALGICTKMLDLISKNRAPLDQEPLYKTLERWRDLLEPLNAQLNITAYWDFDY